MGGLAPQFVSTDGRMPLKTFDSEPRGTLARDLKIFADPGFLISLVLGLLLMGAVGGAILYANIKYGISPF